MRAEVLTHCAKLDTLRRMQAPQPAVFLASVCTFVGVVGLAGCGDSQAPSPPLSDGGRLIDGRSVDGAEAGLPGDDADGDGVCNATELTRGTDPDNPDTDGDGFSDYAEEYLSLDPMMADSPDRATVFILRETEQGTVQVPVMHQVTGAGEDFSGAFESSPVPDLGDVTAEDFYVDSVPTFAAPSDNVSFVDQDGEAFRGVVGETLLGFEVRFAFSGSLPRLCIRGFPFRYNIKGSDGQLQSADRFILLTLPAGDTLTTGEWCLPPGGCI